MYVCVALKQTVCMAETISIMCSSITKLQKVSPPCPLIFITFCLIENFLFALSCAGPGNYHLKWPACSSRIFFSLLLMFQLEIWQWLQQEWELGFSRHNIFQTLNGRRESWREQPVFPQHFFSKTKNKREKETKSAMQMKLWKKNLKQQQEAIDNSCVSIYFLTL